MDEQNSLILEQLTRIASDLGGPVHYRAYLEGDNVADRQWEALAKDGWHLMMSTAASVDAVSLETLCEVSEHFGAELFVAPLMNVTIAHALTECSLPPDSIPVIVPAEDSGRNFLLPALTSATHAAFINQDSGVYEGLIEIARDQAVPTLHPDGQRRVLAQRPLGHSGDRAQHALDALVLTAAAELSGIAGAALQLALQHIKLRKQFRRLLGSFQAVQHRAADSMIAVEEAKSLARQLSRLHDERRLPVGLAHAALSKSIEVAFSVCSSSIQMLGAIGFTAEHDVGLYLKRTMEICRFYGPAASHRARFAHAATR